MLCISKFCVFCLIYGTFNIAFLTSEAARMKGNVSCGGIANCVKCDKMATVAAATAAAGMLHTATGATSSEFQSASGGGNSNLLEMMNVVDGGGAGGPYPYEYRCIKCVHLIVIPTRQCVDQCPAGYVEDWSTIVDYMGRTCKESMAIAGVPLTGHKFAVVLGVSVGIVLCVIVLIAGNGCVRYRRRRIKKCLQQSPADRQSPTLGHLTGTHSSQDSDDSERPEFLKQLAYLRPDAALFLAMLNDTRKQVRQLRQPAAARPNSAMQAYRPVLKDLSRILILLNRPEDTINSPPGDWETLLAWAERILRRYKKQNPHQVSEFRLSMKESTDSVVIGDTTSSFGAASSSYPYPAQLTTFTNTSANAGKPPHRQNHHLQELAISAFDAAYNNQTRRGKKEEVIIVRRGEMCDTRPSSFLDSGGVDLNVTGRDECRSHHQSTTILAEWPPGSSSNGFRGSCYYGGGANDDEFNALGFRPQDEITTEL